MADARRSLLHCSIYGHIPSANEFRTHALKMIDFPNLQDPEAGDPNRSNTFAILAAILIALQVMTLGSFLYQDGRDAQLADTPAKLERTAATSAPEAL